MAWISVHEEIDGKKLRNLYKTLDCSKFEAVGILNFLWMWGLRNAQNEGLIPYADRRDIERHLYGIANGCRLDMKAVVEALIETGWIDEDDAGLHIHDWDMWQKEWMKYSHKREMDKKRYYDKKDQETQQANTEEKKKAPTKAKKKVYGDGFEEFIKVYPRKTGKGAAYDKYVARLRSGWSPEELLAAATEYARICKKNNSEERYIKLAATFLGPNTPFVDYLPKKEMVQKEYVDNPFSAFEEEENG